MLDSRVSAVPHESPSLARPSEGSPPAFELKFLLDEPTAGQVDDWARSRLHQDPHGDPSQGGAYETNSLYFDTPELDVYLGSKGYKRRKLRVRRYGAADAVYLERKSKWGDRVEKRRTVISEEDLPRLSHPQVQLEWQGHWFHRRLVARRLRPACQILYRRKAFVGSCSEGPLRLTMDRCVRGKLTARWGLEPLSTGLPLLDGGVILELKFRAALPAPFRELVADFGLSPRPVSKYRICRDAFRQGLPVP